VTGAESERLAQDAQRTRNWKRWGPYLSERQWGTVREDYSSTGDCWNYFPHEHARSRAYRWGEDGLLGITDRQGRLCFALALWNGRDPILKERLFGLTGPEGTSRSASSRDRIHRFAWSSGYSLANSARRRTSRIATGSAAPVGAGASDAVIRSASVMDGRGVVGSSRWEENAGSARKIPEPGGRSRCPAWGLGSPPARDPGTRSDRLV